MTETTYPLDVAAEMLECQQKKIITEWAKNTISVVMDFGDKPRGARAKMLIDADTQSDMREFFNRYSRYERSFSFLEELTPEQKKRNADIDAEEQRVLLREYGYSGFEIGWSYRENTKSKTHDSDPEKLIIAIDADIFGLWKLNYSDFSRQQVQNCLTLTPYPEGVISGEIKAIIEYGYDNAYKPVKKNLRLTTRDIEIMRTLLSRRTNKQMPPPPSVAIEQQKQHGGVERFALEREKILAAALYVAHHYPKEIGKSFKSHAEAVEKHSYIFWKSEPAPDTGRIAKMISDAARPPEEWKILGGNAKTKK
ncbi:hypothetical protein EJJ45_20800 [Salmonella enterica subsp. enterica serovar Stanley]|nr:hypothetical protein [Salmonella enterica subsp. enterica serovar Stanley]EEE1376005.1 hypothetical protein [Salmonella enterica subsp. diarizonae]HCL5311097.1 hypothetical protein [Salmonella enterica]